LTERPELSWAPEYGVEFHETFAVDVPLSDGQKLEVGSVTIECVHIPGHTPGNMSYFFRIQDNGRIFSVGFHGGHGIKVFADQYLSKYGLSYEARRHYLESIEKMKAWSPDIFIASHPSQNQTLAKYEKMIGKQNPFIDKQAWPAYLSQLLDTAQYSFKCL
jgi:metallo-beta-lactamase class B